MDQININGKPYQVGVDITDGKDYTNVIVIGDIKNAEIIAALSELKAQGIGVVCIEEKNIGAMHISENRNFKELPVPKIIDDIELRTPYCPRKNDNKPWYSRFDKKKKR